MRGSSATMFLDRLLAANERYAAGHPLANLDAPPSERLAIVTCMDARIDPLPLLGLRPGQAHVLRNAGARVTDDVLRSLVISQQALGTDVVIVMPHTSCGLLGLDPATLHPRRAAGRPATRLDFHPMSDLEAALRQDIQSLRESPWIGENAEILGLILDTATGYIVRPDL